ncbi:unnamed protein product, partial [Lampetra planeri]
STPRTRRGRNDIGRQHIINRRLHMLLARSALWRESSTVASSTTPAAVFPLAGTEMSAKTAAAASSNSAKRACASWRPVSEASGASAITAKC